MLQISDTLRNALGVSQKRVSTACVTVPDGEPVFFDLGKGSTVSSSAGAGARRTSSLTLPPKPGRDLFEMIATPGAIFDIEHGVDFGGGHIETVPVFHGEAAQTGSMNIVSGEIRLALVDMWQRVERCRFLDPYTVGLSYRPNIVQAAVVDAIPDTDVIYNAPLGPLLGANVSVVESSRADLIKDMAKDGAFDAYFGPEPDTTFYISPLPILTPSAPVWTYTTGVVGNVKAASRAKPFDRLYNTVVVKPAGEQTWLRQVVQIMDTTHPRHPDKIGVVPFFYSSPTIVSSSEAHAAGNAILQQILGTTDTITLTVLGNPAQETGDTVSAIHPMTDTDPGFAAALLVDSFTLQLDSGEMSITARNSDVAEVTES